MNNIPSLSIIRIDKLCRVCLSEGKSMVSIHSKVKNSDYDASFGELLAELTSVEIDTAACYPNQVCLPCVKLVIQAHNIRTKFFESHNKLQEILNYEPIEETYTFNVEEEIVEPKEPKVSKRKIEKESVKLPTQVRLHPCPICTQEFDALALREHVQSHNSLKKYLSIPKREKIGGNMKFVRRPDDSEVIESIFNREVKLHKCTICYEEFTAIELRKHSLTHREKEEFKCDECGRVFRQINHLNTHRVKHLKEFPYKCEQCNKGFVIKRNYDCHILTHKPEEELPHECSHCLKRFSNPEHLNRHKLIHTENVTYSVKYKVCKCSHCLRTFKDKTELLEHNCQPQGTLSKEFPCKICDKVYKSSCALYTHRRNVHEHPSKERKILCNFCGKYISKTYIYNHMMRHSGEKRYECELCGKKFLERSTFKQHLLVHSGLKPFVCSMCGKAFNNFYNLQVHERIHKGDRCHVCTKCGKGFLEKSYLKKHMNVHAKD